MCAEYIKIILITFLIIFAGHFTWSYIQDKFSPRKTKDLVNTQIQKYKSILQEIQNAQTQTQVQSNTVEESNMNEEDELLAYANSLL